MIEEVEARTVLSILSERTGESGPRPRLFTREEFDRAIELGLFGPDERLELIGGEILVKMTHNSPHATGIRAAEEALRPVFSAGYDVRVQMPLALDDISEPEPDVAVVTGSFRDYSKAHPTSAVLVVEVADSTLAQDRGRKASLYASAGIADYWVVNLVDRSLEVHRQPAPVAAQPFGYHYREILTLGGTESVAPLAAPQSPIPVKDLLP